MKKHLFIFSLLLSEQAILASETSITKQTFSTFFEQLKEQLHGKIDFNTLHLVHNFQEGTFTFNAMTETQHSSWATRYSVSFSFTLTVPSCLNGYEQTHLFYDFLLKNIGHNPYDPSWNQTSNQKLQEFFTQELADIKKAPSLSDQYP
jgi:hypothetical protein